MNTCPTCGRKFAAVKSEEKKQSADRAKAWQAIAVLERFIAKPSFMAHERAYPALCSLVVVRAEEERQRLVAALDDPEALRMIYRRNEKRSKSPEPLAMAA